jgi:hypothetical protein
MLTGNIRRPQPMPEPVTVFQPPRPAANPAPAVPEHHVSQVRSAAIADGVRSSPDITPAQARWKADFDAITKSDPWRDPSVLITKDPQTGIISTRPRAATPDAAAQPQQPGQQQPGQQPPQPAPQVQPGTATSDGNKLKVGAYELSESDIASLMAEKSQRDCRAALMPATAAEFKLDLPADFQLPAGTSEFAWDLETPHAAAQLGALKNWAHANQLDQSSFSQLLSIYAGHMLSEQQRFAEAQKAEIGKLGVNAPTRIDSVNTWLESRVGSELAAALRTSMFTSKAVEAYEALMRGFISQGISGNPAGARDGSDAGREPPRLSDADYAKLTFAQKDAYARQFDQSRHQR